MSVVLRSMLAVLLLPGGCQKPAEPGESRGSTTPRYERAGEAASPLEQATRPVRIGELGPSFAACNARGTTRAPSPLTVRAAPYEPAVEIGSVPAGAHFFICSRSLDQRWLGIVYGEAGIADESCGVSRPIPARRDYAGPCRSGWVASAAVKLVAR